LNGINKNIIEEYKNTIYRVYYKDKYFDIKAEEKNLEIDNLLKKLNSKSWCFITAYNPMSIKISENKNIELNLKLEKEIKNKNYKYLYSEGIPKDKNWNIEKSFFILDINFEEITYLGKKYNQKAVLIGKIYEKSEFLFFEYEK
jgi:hypothetical protein